eukprot:CAMPEP_0113484884 /NCGR_PEP_ID=MMETSP0014_2-20120614/24197_1 /TAXON_ID=2857 /ORGANISM="Nitzschia sp." /LENGTH=527 /DNA_ID=CAMNT_0000378511 /DNA_START=1065 /DNA_END=2648 /DNA_ORIENTATION=+ /assembly_acc=CAM_ASM_000159
MTQPRQQQQQLVLDIFQASRTTTVTPHLATPGPREEAEATIVNADGMEDRYPHILKETMFPFNVSSSTTAAAAGNTSSNSTSHQQPQCSPKLSSRSPAMYGSSTASLMPFPLQLPSLPISGSGCSSLSFSSFEDGAIRSQPCSLTQGHDEGLYSLSHQSMSPLSQDQTPMQHPLDRFTDQMTSLSYKEVTPPLQHRPSLDTKISHQSFQPQISSPPLFRSQQRKSVSFLNATVVGTVDSRSMMSMEDRDQVWYRNHELGSFKEEAKDLCRRNMSSPLSSSSSKSSPKVARREISSSSPLCNMSPPGGIRKRRLSISPPPPSHTSANIPHQQSVPATSANLDDDKVDSCRGMESRVCIRRQRNKLLSERCILKAQAKNRNPDFIASISLKCSVYAKEVAAAQGMIDYCEVYFPHLIPHLPKIKDLPQHPFPIKTKTTESSPTRMSTTTSAIATTSYHGSTGMASNSMVPLHTNRYQALGGREGAQQHRQYSYMELSNLRFSSGMKRSFDDLDDPEEHTMNEKRQPGSR